MNTIAPLGIQRIDTRRDDVRQALDRLREKLSPQGDVVSEQGRQRTLDVFGEPLSPQQVVERICRDVQRDGLAAVLDYSEKLDGAHLTAETVRVSQEDIEQAHRSAAPDFLETVRRIRDTILEFYVQPSEQKDDGLVANNVRLAFNVNR